MSAGPFPPGFPAGFPNAPQQAAPVAPVAPSQAAPTNVAPAGGFPGGGPVPLSAPVPPQAANAEAKKNLVNLASFDIETMAPEMVDENSSLADRPDPPQPGDRRFTVALASDCPTFQHKGATYFGEWKHTEANVAKGKPERIFAQLVIEIEIADGEDTGRKRKHYVNTLVMESAQTSAVDDLYKAIKGSKLQGANPFQKIAYLQAELAKKPTVWGRIDWEGQTLEESFKDRKSLRGHRRCATQDGSGKWIPLPTGNFSVVNGQGQKVTMSLPMQVNWDVEAWLAPAQVAANQAVGGGAGLPAGIGGPVNGAPGGPGGPGGFTPPFPGAR